MRLLLALSLLLCCWFNSFGQKDFFREYYFSEADTLRGKLRPERSCYDVHFYELNLEINIEEQFISGYVDIHFEALEDFHRLQIDLFSNMQINSILFEEKELEYQRRFNAVFVQFPDQYKGDRGKFRVYYEGHPRVAPNAPWQGGFVWGRDKNGAPWVGVACEGEGASLWWPNKDHLSDEPDSMAISIAVPKDLTCVANGNLRSVEEEGNLRRFNWFVSYPINNYNVTLNIANYVHFSDTYEAFDGDQLAMDFYVLDYNEEKARQHFQQVHKVMACFELYFGKYPFWEDGLALVETSYLGMEHQGAIAYGNHYQRGYLGGMIPRDMNWDYVIVHEIGHEYFGNSISCNDMAEIWIHESFTTYMEALYVECVYSYPDAVRYMVNQRWLIGNKEPILGPMDVNWENWSDSDHYYKGSWVLHTLRHAINYDAMWFDLLWGFYDYYALSNVTTQDFIDYVHSCTRVDYSWFFEQYLEYPGIPTFEYELQEEEGSLILRYRWLADVPDFKMPLLVGKRGAYQMIHPTTQWQSSRIEGLTEQEFRVATELFYIREKEVKR